MLSHVRGLKYRAVLQVDEKNLISSEGFALAYNHSVLPLNPLSYLQLYGTP